MNGFKESYTKFHCDLCEFKNVFTLLDYSNSRLFLEYNCVKNCSALFLHKSRMNKKQLGLLLITTELDSHHNIFRLSHLDLTAVVLFA